MVITVERLREVLGTYPQDAAVLLSSDEEGNSFRYLVSIDPYAIYKSHGHDIEVGLTELDDDLVSLGFGEDDLMTDGLPAIILYPA